MDVLKNGCFHDPKCKGVIRSVTLPVGTWLYQGRREQLPAKSADAFTLVEKKDSDNATISFYTLALDSSIISYAYPFPPSLIKTNGYVCAYRLMTPIHLYGQTDIMGDCAIFFNSQAEYASKAAQCFCKHPFDGYCTLLLDEKKQLTDVTDIAICSPHTKLLPMAWIPRIAIQALPLKDNRAPIYRFPDADPRYFAEPSFRQSLDGAQPRLIELLNSHNI